jgi:uncharacterized protein
MLPNVVWSLLHGDKSMTMPVSMAWKEEPVQFSSLGEEPASLMGIIHLPESEQRAPGVIICHPQPLIANMHDPLCVAIAKAVACQGMTALRFNFRGVAPSTGTMTDGRLETFDIAGALAWLRARPNIDGRIALVGHGFGATQALVYAGIDARVDVVVAISPPWFALMPDTASALQCPALFITGEHDEVCPPFKLEPWMAHITAPKGLSIIHGAQHMLNGYEAETAELIMNYLVNWSSALANL